jgi:hypothetical protein
MIVCMSGPPMGHGTLSLSRDGGTAKRVNFARHVHVAAEMQRGMAAPAPVLRVLYMP